LQAPETTVSKCDRGLNTGLNPGVKERLLPVALSRWRFLVVIQHSNSRASIFVGKQEIEQLDFLNNVQDILGFHYDSNQVKIPSKTLEWQAVN